MNDHIKREEAVHGEAWNSIHGGYFSDPAVAAPLVGKVCDLTAESRAQRIIDLGGGNGCLLGLIKSGGVADSVSLINIESSKAQLSAARRVGISCVHCSVDKFLRHDLGPQDVKSLFVMRSVLHYFGEKGLRPAIRHIRAQARTGEFWIHQTASFEQKRDADCLNALYGMMNTSKWYPTVDRMTDSLDAEGWQVREVLPCPALPLTSESLLVRYGLDCAAIGRIGSSIAAGHTVPDTVFRRAHDGFCAFLHYWIYVCTPVD